MKKDDGNRKKEKSGLSLAVAAEMIKKADFQCTNPLSVEPYAQCH